MTEKSALDDIERPEEADDSASPLRVALGFFILPMLLVIGAVGVFLLFGLIAHEDKTVDEYLAEVTGGGINEPWQGAFGLANKLVLDESRRDPVTHELGSFRIAPEVRRYFASLALVSDESPLHEGLPGPVQGAGARGLHGVDGR